MKEEAGFGFNFLDLYKLGKKRAITCIILWPLIISWNEGTVNYKAILMVVINPKGTLILPFSPNKIKR